MSHVLAVDVGTTTMKMAVVEEGKRVLKETSASYPMTIRPGGQYDIDTALWWDAFLSCCETLCPYLDGIKAIGLSVSTPGTVALDAEGNALTPAVLFLDGRSGKEAQWIRDSIGEDVLLEKTSNLPVSGGCTASTILWWKNNTSTLFERARFFGHTNTLFGKRLTGEWGMDPSTASLTALYNTTTNNFTWNNEIADRLKIPICKLPPIIPSWEPVGLLLPHWAEQTGLPRDIPVLMGGNDAMCAALHGGVTHEGAILDVCGTCEIICIGLAKSLPGSQYNVRCHVIPNLWSTLYVLNTGGKALEWFHNVFCQDLSADAFYNDYIPQTIKEYLNNDTTLPDYSVYLAGDRYSTSKKYAGFSNVALETTREAMLMAIIKGNNQYMARHLHEMGDQVSLSKRIHLTGGGLSKAFIQCKKKWMGDYEYVIQDNSSLLGAAQLAHYHVSGEKIWEVKDKQS